MGARQVGVVDERSEIAGSYMGMPGNQLGIRTDILDGCPKDQGIMMLIRSMAPEVIAVDEIGSSMDMQSVKAAWQCGCRMIATIHGDSMEDVYRHGIEKGGFERFAFLGRKEDRYVLLKVCSMEGEDRYA